MTPLSPHFSLEELTITQVRGADNTPPDDIIANLRNTAQHMEAVRSMLGKPITVNSAFRSKRVNELVGGAVNSAHMTGHAVDFICPAYGTPLEICRVIDGSDMHFDQLIEEGTWVHISFAPTMRRQVLTKAGKGFVAGLKQDKGATV